MPTTDVFTCSKCGEPKPRSAFHEAGAHDRTREVTSRCRDCRSKAYFAKRYPETVCAQCLEHRPLDTNGICSRCNEETGLRQCRACSELLPLYLKFYAGRKTCKDCAKKARTSKTED